MSETWQKNSLGLVSLLTLPRCIKNHLQTDICEHGCWTQAADEAANKVIQESDDIDGLGLNTIGNPAWKDIDWGDED